MWIKIRFHGHLKDKLGSEMNVPADTMIEAIRYLSVNFKDKLKPPLSLGRWPVKIPGYETKESFYCPLHTKEADIYPLFDAGKSDWGNIIIGGLLIVGGMLLAPYTGGASLAISEMGFSQLAAYAGMHIAFAMGTALLLNGVMNLISPAPKTTSNPSDPEASKYLGVPGNTVALGTYIPVGYGRYKVSGHYVSFNINTTEFVYQEEG